MKTNYILFNKIMNITEDRLNKHIKEIEDYFQSEFLYIDSDITYDFESHFDKHFGWLLSDNMRKQKLTIFINSNGGIPKVVFNLVKKIRDNFHEVFFIVKNALSAATLLCLSGDKLFVGLFTKMGDLRLQICDGNYNYQFEAFIENELKEIENSITLSNEGKELISNIKSHFKIKDNLKNQERIKETALIYLKTYMFKEYNSLDDSIKKQIDEIPEKLTDSNYLNSIGCFYHSTGLYWNDLNNLGLKIKKISELENKVFDAILEFSNLVLEFKSFNSDNPFFNNFIYSKNFLNIITRSKSPNTLTLA